MKHLIIIIAIAATFIPQHVVAKDCDTGWTPIPHGCRAPNKRTLSCDPGYQGRFTLLRDSTGRVYRVIGRCAEL